MHAVEVKTKNDRMKMVLPRPNPYKRLKQHGNINVLTCIIKVNFSVPIALML